MVRPVLFCLASLLLTANAEAGRVTVAATPLAPSGEAPGWIGEALAESLNLRIHYQLALNSLTLRQVSAALAELELSGSVLYDPGIAARVGRQLGADLVVTGAYAVAGERLTLTVRVVDTASEELRAWERRRFRSEELGAAEAWAAGVVARVLGSDGPVPLPGPGVNGRLGAWEETTRALAILGAQSLSPRAADPLAPPALTPSELAEAGARLRRATEEDPTYGRAWAALAITEALGGEPAAGWQTLGRATANGAGEDPLTVLGGAFIRLRQGRIDEATEILRAAIDRRPGFLHARGNLGHLYNHYGRFREARGVFRAYAEVAPRQPWALAQIGYANARLGQRTQAIADTQGALALLPDSPYLQLELASRYIDARDLAAARETLERVLAQAPGKPALHSRLSYVHLLAGDDRAAIASAAEALRLATGPRDRRERAYAHLNLARAHGRLGELDLAFEELRGARAEGLSDLTEVEADPALAALRADPRWLALSP